MTQKLHPVAVQQAKLFKNSKIELVEILSQMDVTKEYAEHGANSLWAYCVNILSLSPHDTAQLTQVIRKSVDVPALKDAVTNGTLSVEKASRITSVITKENEELWIKKASQSTHREIEKAVKTEKPEELRKERIQPKTKEISELRVNISERVEAKLRRAREVFRATSYEETIEKALDVALEHKDPIQKAERAKNLHRTCDVQTKRVENKSVSSRMSHYIPIPLRHQVVLRDKQKCQEKGCHSSYFVEIHHVTPISEGGKHELSNLITLCSFHHSQRHGFQKQNYNYKSPTQSTLGNTCGFQPGTPTAQF